MPITINIVMIFLYHIKLNPNQKAREREQTQMSNLLRRGRRVPSLAIRIYWSKFLIRACSHSLTQSRSNFIHTDKKIQSMLDWESEAFAEQLEISSINRYSICVWKERIYNIIIIIIIQHHYRHNRCRSYIF